jgi:hypothetical protein
VVMGDTNVGRRHSAKMSSRFGETISGFLGVAAICRRNAVNRNNQDTKNEKPTVLYGTGKAAPKSSTILGPLRRKWLYVGRIIGNEVSENDVKDYLQNIDCHDEIIIKKLTTKGHNSAFSIGVPPKIFNDVFNPDIWPDSVCLREFNVRSFLEKKRHIQNNM